MSTYIIGAKGDANSEAGHLPSQVANTALDTASQPQQGYTGQVMGWLEKTLRQAARPAGHTIVKEDKVYHGKRHKLWKSRETGAVLWVWPERGFVHVERDSDGFYKKWTCRDALRLATAFGQQSEAALWPDEKQNARNAYLLLVEVVREARAQGDPMIPTDEEKRALRESVVCATVPGMGKITFVGSKATKVEPDAS